MQVPSSINLESENTVSDNYSYLWSDIYAGFDDLPEQLQDRIAYYCYEHGIQRYCATYDETIEFLVDMSYR